MKKIFLISVLISTMFVSSCSTHETTQTSDYQNNISEISTQVSDKNTINVTFLNASVNDKIVSSVNYLDITEEECQMLVCSLYNDIVSIVQEFYGFPNYLNMKPCTEIHYFGEIYYEPVIYLPSKKITSTIDFPNDAGALREILNEYFTDELINLAFNLQYPCPVYEKNGELYRTIYEPATTNRGCDIAAGRIVLRQNESVRYAFPIYQIDKDSDVPNLDSHWMYGYIDLIRENGKWKINDFRLADSTYSHSYFPGGKAIITEDDFFTLDDNKEIEGVEINLDGEKNVSIEFSGKSITAELTKRASKIKGIEKAGGNIFVSFLGAFGELETLVISETDATISTRFVSHGFCTTENGDWYYLTVDRENRLCDILDKNGAPIHGFAAIKQELAQYRSLPEIAPIDDIELGEDGFTIIYDITGY